MAARYVFGSVSRSELCVLLREETTRTKDRSLSLAPLERERKKERKKESIAPRTTERERVFARRRRRRRRFEKRENTDRERDARRIPDVITFKNVNTKLFALVPSLIGQPPLLRLLPVLRDQNLARLHQPRRRRRRLFFFFFIVVVVVHQVLERLLRAELRAFDFRPFPNLRSRFALDFHHLFFVVSVFDELGVRDGHASASLLRRRRRRLSS